MKLFSRAASVFVAFLILADTLSYPARAEAPVSGVGDARFHDIVSAFVADGFMGSVLVAKGEDTLFSEGFGKADLGWSENDAPEVKFRIASLTKQFTAALVLLEAQDGKLRLADPVNKYLKDTPAGWNAITIADLLRQTSGIPNFTDDSSFQEWSMSPHTPAQEILFIENKPLQAVPGNAFSYSDSNYEVLGVILEKVSGERYGDLLRERILEPLGMKNSGLDTDDLILTERAQGYRHIEGAFQGARSESMSVPWAAGSMYSNTTDLLRWERALLEGKLLSNASLSSMTTPGKGDYGYGLFIQQRNGERVIWHNGDIEGFHSFLAYIPNEHTTVVVLSNVESGLTDIIGSKLVDASMGKVVLPEGQLKSLSLSRTEAEKLEGEYNLDADTVLKVNLDREGLVLGVGEKSMPMIYQGFIDAQPTFYVVPIHATISFTAGENGHGKILHLQQGMFTQNAEHK